jgi:RNA polymerase sigma factor (sigma-70 family)
VREPEVASQTDGDRLSSPEPSKKHERHVELEKLLSQHNDALVNYVYSWVRSRADARDIVQEAYCRIFRLDEPHIISHLRAYLYKTAKNITTDWIRQRIVREAYVEEAPLRAPQETPSPERIWLAREDLETLQRGIEALPPKTKMALLMVRQDGLSYEEVGHRLGIKTHSARRLVERAMEYLLEAMEREERKLR